MTILFKCDKVIRSMKNKIVKKGERKSMKKRKYLALLLAAGMIAQTALSTGGVVQVQAAEDTYVKTDELTDNDTAAPKRRTRRYRQRISMSIRNRNWRILPLWTEYI